MQAVAQRTDPWRIMRILLSGMMLAGCGWLFPVERIEVVRETAPDGKVDLVVVRANGGATTSMAYFVHLAPPGDDPSRDTEVALIEGINGDKLNFTWESSELLRIRAPGARIRRFRNKWSHPAVDRYLHAVWIDLLAPPPVPGGSVDMPDEGSGADTAVNDSLATGARE